MSDSGRLLILADDFTGACDAAAAFAASRGTLVVHGLPAQWPRDADEIEVLGVDLDLRERSNADAQALARATARLLCDDQPHIRVFLKIDSTLRGPIAGLVTGALVGSRRHIAVVAPAFPEQGRLLHEGRLVVDGRPGASLTEALGMEHTALLGANFVRSPEEVELAVEHARTRGARHIVVDTDRVDCLHSVATAWQRHAHEWLLVGSAGLARQVAGVSAHPVSDLSPTAQPVPASELSPTAQPVPVSDLSPTAQPVPASDLSPTGQPVLVVAGSPAPATQAQIDQLSGLGQMVVVKVHSPVPRRPSGDYPLLVLCSGPAAERDAGESARAIAEAIAAWAAEFTPAAVVLAGGATARLVCERLGVRGVRLQGELQPGIPYGYLVNGRWNGLRVVTKAGGFGMPNTLLDVVHALGVSSIAAHS